MERDGAGVTCDGRLFHRRADRKCSVTDGRQTSASNGQRYWWGRTQSLSDCTRHIMPNLHLSFILDCYQFSSSLLSVNVVWSKIATLFYSWCSISSDILHLRQLSPQLWWDNLCFRDKHLSWFSVFSTF